jgi:hypothetical protein
MNSPYLFANTILISKFNTIHKMNSPNKLKLLKKPSQNLKKYSPFLNRFLSLFLKLS